MLEKPSKKRYKSEEEIVDYILESMDIEGLWADINGEMVTDFKKLYLDTKETEGEFIAFEILKLIFIKFNQNKLGKSSSSNGLDL